MEMLIVVCSSTLQDAVEDFFEQNGIASYTQVPEVVGSGQGGGTRLNNDVWPGLNTLYLIVPTPDQVAKLKTWAREYRQADVREGLKIFSIAAQEII